MPSTWHTNLLFCGTSYIFSERRLTKIFWNRPLVNTAVAVVHRYKCNIYIYTHKGKSLSKFNCKYLVFFVVRSDNHRPRLVLLLSLYFSTLYLSCHGASVSYIPFVSVHILCHSCFYFAILFKFVVARVLFERWKHMICNLSTTGILFFFTCVKT